MPVMEKDVLKVDVRKLYSEIQYEEKLRRKKRRWLMGLRVYESSRSQMKFIPEFLHDVSLPESFLRDDDVSGEVVRTSIERSFEALIGEQGGHYVVQDFKRLFDVNMNCNTVQQSIILRTINSALDDLNNNGLSYLSTLATGNSIKFEKTRPRMKEFIRKHLPTRLGKTNDKALKDALVQVLMDPSNFRKNQLSNQTPAPQSLVSAATKVLERLDDMDNFTLLAMERKRRGEILVPRLKSYVPRMTGKRLVKQIRDTSNTLLSKLSEGDELPSSLAKALSVAGLWLKQRGEPVDFPIPDFYPFPPEIKALQNQIIKAIRSLGKVEKRMLRNLERVLDPVAVVPRRIFRARTRRLLTEYLYECGDVDIPNSLLRALTLINSSCAGRPRISCSRETMEEELECVLDVSSQLRQIIWEMLPDHNIDQRFADAYVDDLESGDEEENSDIELNNDGNCTYFEYSNVPVLGNVCLGKSDCLRMLASHSDDESVGDSGPTFSTVPVSAVKESSASLLAEACTNFFGYSTEEPHHLRDQHGFVTQSCLEGLMGSQSSQQEALDENQYLAMQDICDETSLIAYRLIGRLLEEFLQIEGIDLDTSMILYLRGGTSTLADSQGAETMQADSMENIGGLLLKKAVKELVPSFPQSGIETVKELMGLL